MKCQALQRMNRGLLVSLGAAALLAITGAAWAQESYPDRPIRLLAPAIGGAGDWAARTLAAGLEKELGRRIIVENKPNIVAVELAADARPDGYTLLYYGSGLWMYPLLNPGASYDPVKNFQPITMVATTPNMIAVNPSLGIKTLPELIALAKAKPGQLNYAAAQVGTLPHLTAERFKAAIGLQITYVAYSGLGPATTSTVAGETQISFLSADVASQHVHSGRLIALAVFSDKRSELATGIPTATEAGVPGLEASTKQVLWAPAGIPKAILDKLNKAAVKVLSSPEIKKAFLDRGSELDPGTPEEAVQTVQAEVAKWGKIIADVPDVISTSAK